MKYRRSNGCRVKKNITTRSRQTPVTIFMTDGGVISWSSSSTIWGRGAALCTVTFTWKILHEWAAVETAIKSKAF